MELSKKIKDRQAEIDELVKILRPPQKPLGAFPRTSPTLPDEEIFELLGKAKNTDRIKPLMQGSIMGYALHSEADQALCNHIAFYTQDPEQIDRIFRQSALYRDKWEREDYRARTIYNAIAGKSECYGSKNGVSTWKAVMKQYPNLLRN